MTLPFPHPSSPGARGARTGYSHGKVVALFLVLRSDNVEMQFLSEREKLFVTGHHAEESRQHAPRISGKGKAVLISDNTLFLLF